MYLYSQIQIILCEKQMTNEEIAAVLFFEVEDCEKFNNAVEQNISEFLKQTLCLNMP